MNEVEGRDYHFVNDAVFDRMVGEGAFLEWAKVHDHRYGTPREPVENMKAAGRDLILDLDTQGALAVKADDPTAVLIFIDAPDLRVLEERLGKRGTEDYDKMKKRLEHAERERKEKDKYDHVLINEDLEKAYNELVSVIQKERTHRGRT
jgi:guanylate kinase